MDKAFFDTSGFVAIFGSDDRWHKKALEIFEGIKKDKLAIYTSDYIIDETATTIMARSGHQHAIKSIEAIFSSSFIKIINVCPDYFGDAWKLYKKYHDKEFSFTDVTSFTIMQKLGIKKAFSFDSYFAQVGMELL